MSFAEELKSGNGTVYGQWSALIAIVCLIIGVFALSFNVAFLIIALIEVFFLILLELPICQKCCPSGPKMTACIRYFEGSYLRAVLYFIFSVIMFFSVSAMGAFTVYAFGAICLLLSSLFNGVAGFRHQERQNSVLVGGSPNRL